MENELETEEIIAAPWFLIQGGIQKHSILTLLFSFLFSTLYFFLFLKNIFFSVTLLHILNK